MKVGDLVRWDRDGDIGLVLGFVQVGESDDDEYKGNPKITWTSWAPSGDLDCTCQVWDEDLEVISENR